jgi:hypothetical protein
VGQGIFTRELWAQAAEPLCVCCLLAILSGTNIRAGLVATFFASLAAGICLGLTIHFIFMTAYMHTHFSEWEYVAVACAGLGGHSLLQKIKQAINRLFTIYAGKAEQRLVHGRHASGDGVSGKSSRDDVER